MGGKGGREGEGRELLIIEFTNLDTGVGGVFYCFQQVVIFGVKSNGESTVDDTAIDVSTYVRKRWCMRIKI